MRKFLPYILILVVLAGMLSPMASVNAQSTVQCTSPQLPTQDGHCVTRGDTCTTSDGKAGVWQGAGILLCSSQTGTLPVVQTPAAPAQTGNALYDSLASCPSSFNGCIEVIIYWIFYSIPAFLLGVVGNLFDAIIGLTLSSALFNASFIATAWAVVRDLSNIFFILVLLYIAIQLILGLGGHDTKKMIAKVIIMALLINFSMFFTEIVIDASNILALVFYNKIIVVTVNNSSTVGIDDTNNYVPTIGSQSGVVTKDLSGGMMSYFNPTTILTPAFFDKFRTKTYEFSVKGALASAGAGAIVGNLIPIPGVGAGIGAAVGTIGYVLSGIHNDVPTPIIVGFIIVCGLVMIVATYAFFMSAFGFLSRFIELWILIIFSPFAFMSFSIPKLAGVEYLGWNSWFKRLLEVSFMAPIFMFFMYFIFMLIKTNIFQSLAASDPSNQGWMETIILMLIPALTVITLLLQATKFAKKSSGVIGEKLMDGAKIIGGLAVGAATGVPAAIGVATLGRASNAVTNSGWLKDVESGETNANFAQKFIAARTRDLGALGSKSSFDIRGAKIGGKTLGSATGMSVGQAQKGGFVAAREQQIAKRQERAKRLEVTENEEIKQDLNKTENALHSYMTQYADTIESLDKLIEKKRQDVADVSQKYNAAKGTAGEEAARRNLEYANSNLDAARDDKINFRLGKEYMVTNAAGESKIQEGVSIRIGDKNMSLEDLEQLKKKQSHEIKITSANRKHSYASGEASTAGVVKGFILSGGIYLNPEAREAEHKIIMGAKIPIKGGHGGDDHGGGHAPTPKPAKKEEKHQDNHGAAPAGGGHDH